MLEKIREDIERRMGEYTDSRQPTNDEVAIAWLIGRVDELQEEIDRGGSHW